MEWFLKEGIPTELQEITPIEDFTGKNWQLYFGDYSLDEPTISPKTAEEKGLTYASALKIKAKLRCKGLKI